VSSVQRQQGPQEAGTRSEPEPEGLASTRRQVAFGLVAMAVFLVVLYLLRDEMGAFVLGAFIAFLIGPWVRRLCAVGIPRVLAIFVTLIVLLIALAGLLTLVVPFFSQEVTVLGAQAPNLAAAAQSQLTRLHGRPLEVLGYPVDLSSMAQTLSGHAGDFLLGQFGNALSFGIAALGTLAQVGLMVLVAFFASLDAPQIRGFIRSVSPNAYRSDVDSVLHQLKAMLNAYIRGQLVVASVMGLICGAAVWLIGLPYPLALGMLAAISALIPYLGPFLAVIPALIVALSQSWQQAVAVLIAYVVISNVALNVVYPRIVGRAVRLPALVVIVAFLAGFGLGGVLGMFVAVPVAATARIIYDHFQRRLYGATPSSAN
jgi:predicted PurR-regulated permease PerM